MQLSKFFLSASSAAVLCASIFPVAGYAVTHQSAKKSTATKVQSQAQQQPMAPLSDGYWTAHIGLGGGSYSSGTNNDNFAVTRIETDSLSETSKSTNLFYDLGLQHITPVNKDFISAFGIGPELYYQPGSFSGQVYQFQLPAFNNYFYKSQVRPWNLYVEGDLYFQTIENYVTPYIFVGLGGSFVNVSYSEDVTPAALAIGVPANSALAYRSDWNQLLAEEVGAGVNVNFLQHYFIGARYVYQHTGRAEVSGPDLLSPIKVRLNSNSGYIVVGYRFE